jgi:pimeloyl-ACP methyl ester carboxylesterase
MLCAVALSLVACSSEAPETDDRFVAVDDHRLRLVCSGEGTPAVVFDAGIGAGAESWAPVVELLAPHVRACAYDRAGYGRSDPGPFPRDSRTVARELHGLVEGAGIPRPFVLVGHSLGALNAQVYATLYPEDLAGLVLLDPPPRDWIAGREFEELRAMAEEMTAEWSRAAEDAARGPGAGAVRRSVFLNTLSSEHAEMFDTSAEQALDIESFGSLPLVVVASGVPNPMFGDNAEAFQSFWISQSRGLARRSREGRFVLAESCTHNLCADDPELVVDAILSLIHAHGGRQ